MSTRPAAGRRSMSRFDPPPPAPPRPGDDLRGHDTEEGAQVRLWDGFVEGAGGEGGAEPPAETADCVSSWGGPEGSLESLARLFAIESGQPEIARVKREG